MAEIRLGVHFARPHQHQRSKLIDSSCCISVPFSKHHNTLNSIHKIFLGICTCRFELLWRFDVLISWVWYFAFCGISLLFFHRTFQFESRGPIFWRHRSTTTAICWWYIIVIYFFWISKEGIWGEISPSLNVTCKWSYGVISWPRKPTDNHEFE